MLHQEIKTLDKITLRFQTTRMIDECLGNCMEICQQSYFTVRPFFEIDQIFYAESK